MANNDSKAFSYPPFDPSVIDQIELRQLYLGNNPRLNSRSDVQQWKFNNSSWIRLASSINLDITQNSKGEVTGAGNTLIKKIFPNITNPLEYAGDKLAKNFILFGGVSKAVNENINQKDILTSNLRSLNSDYFINVNPDGDLINDFTYGFGGLTQGIRPMPGIKSVNITYLNRGTNAKAEIEIIAFTREQLAIIEALYLHPGYNLLLEWGHSLYPSNSNKAIIQANFNDTSAFTKLFSGKQFNVGTMAKIIHNDSLARSGNYEGMFGPVSNFNYKFNPDGTYSITIYMQSVGLLAESLKLNTSSSNAKYQPGVSAVIAELQARLEKEKAALDKLEAETRAEAAETLAYEYSTQSSIDYAESNTSDNTAQLTVTYVGPNGVPIKTTTANANRLSRIDEATAIVTSTEAELKLKLAGATPTPDNLTGALRFANILNYWLDNESKTMDNYKQDNDPGKSTYDLLYSEKGLYRKGFLTSTKNQKQEVNSKDKSVTTINQPGTETYIRLGTLLQFISNNLLMYNDDKTAIFEIDYETTNNVCTRHRYSMSSDPTICVVENPDIVLGTYSDGSSVTPEDKLTTEFPFKKSDFLGNTMNIFVNINFASVAAVQYTDVDGNISLFDYLKHLMNGIKAALGYINDWEISYDSLRNKITIKELAYVKSGDARVAENPAQFNIYGFNPKGDGQEGSFVENVEFNVTLDSKFQANAVVNASSGGGDVLGEDTTALATYNKGLIDRTFKNKYSQNLLGLTKEQKEPNSFNQEEYQKLNELAIAFYGPTQSIDTEKIGEFGNVLTTVGKYLISYQVKEGKRTPKNVIPFDLSLTIMGLGGIKLYERYTADDKVLPPNFANLDFIVKAVSHVISDNKWTTKIQSLAVASSRTANFIDDTKYNKIISAIISNNNSGDVWTGNEPQFRSRSTVKSIILHVTDGAPTSTAQQTVDWVGGPTLANTLKNSGFSWWNKSGIHYAVDRSGGTASGVPELKISVHGDNWNEWGVGIEVVGAFSAINVNGATGNSKTFPTVKINDVIDLGFKYNGTQYTQEFTDRQIQSLESLINDIISRYPDIKKGINGSLWKKVFGLPGGKPTSGSNVKSQPAKNYSQYGIFAHATGGGTHVDIQPTPKIIEMLKRLGYTE
jgi:hypothetical protein